MRFAQFSKFLIKRLLNGVNMIKYFHELTYAEHFDIYNKMMSWRKVKKKYPEPPWCSNDLAVGGLMGCEELMMSNIKSELDCMECRFYKRGKS